MHHDLDAQTRKQLQPLRSVLVPMHAQITTGPAMKGNCVELMGAVHYPVKEAELEKANAGDADGFPGSNSPLAQCWTHSLTGANALFLWVFHVAPF